MNAMLRPGATLAAGIVVIPLLGVLTSGPAAAWTRLPCRQIDTDITYRVANSANYVSVANEAAREWRDRSRADYRQVGGPADVITRDGQFGTGPGTPTGFTEWTNRPNCGAGGTFPTPDHVNVYINSSFTANRNFTERKTIMGHELGHAVGLDHEDNAPTCLEMELMFPAFFNLVGCGVSVPRADDINGANAILP